MHDTLIQGCASVSALLEAHSSLAQHKPDGNGDLLDCARTQLRSTIEEARQAVWGLRSLSESTTDITSLLGKMADQFTHEFAVPVNFHVSGASFALDQSVVHEVLMVAREALYNSIRHAQPSKVSLTLTFEEASCRIRIHDDGSGFDPAMLSRLPENHYGLIGIKERVERIGGKFTLCSEVGGGTDLSIEVPRPTAPAANRVAEIAL